MNFANHKWVVMIAGLLAVTLAACSAGTDSSGTETPAAEDPTPAAADESPTEAPDTGNDGEIITLYVAPETAECVGVGPQTCLLVKEHPEDEYQFFYDQIEGFTYEPGFEYELKVQVTPVENPPSDASSLHYTLVEEVSKTAVAGTESATDDPLDGSQWILSSYVNASGESATPLPDSEITLEFREQGVSGNAGCNGYFGSYTLDGNSIALGPVGSTEMFCEPVELMDQESAYLAALNQASQVSLAAGQLILADAQGETLLTFTSRESTSLTGTVWQATGVNNGRGGVASVLAGTEITAVFGDDGSLGGSAGCNSYNTTYTTDGDNLTISDQMAVTLRACTPEQDEQERAYLAALGQAATYHVDGDSLEIRDADGALLAQYTAVPQAGLSAGTWLATGYASEGDAFVSIISGMRLTAQFLADGNLNGHAGCNTYGGSYTVDGTNLTIGPLMSTMKACDDAVMAQETAFLAALQSAASYQIMDQMLTLFSADGVPAVTFTLEAPPTLAGSQWDVISYNNGNQAVVSLIIGSEITAVFGEDGTLTGSAGCNNYTATYEAGLENISIDPAAATRMFCDQPEGVMEQEAAYLAALETAVTYRIDGPRMEMRTVDGALVASFQQAGYVDPEIQTFLANATYTMELAQMGEVTLVDGEYREPAADTGATELVVTLTDHTAVGTLNEQLAVATVLIGDPGGSGTFYYLSLFTPSESGLENTAVLYLGDRVGINSVNITGNTIVVDMVQSGPEDPLCCPTQHVINVYELEGNELGLVSSTPVNE